MECGVGQIFDLVQNTCVDQENNTFVQIGNGQRVAATCGGVQVGKECINYLCKDGMVLLLNKCIAANKCKTAVLGVCVDPATSEDFLSNVNC